MKKGILVFLTLVAMVTMGNAQHRSHGDRFEQKAAQMDEFFKEIEVTDAQMKEIQDARKEMGEALKELRGQGRNEETRRKMESIRSDHAEKMKSILNEEQFTRWEEKAGDHQKRKHKRIGSPE